MNKKITPGLLNWIPAKAEGFYCKNLLKIDSGSVRLIKIEPGASYPLHIHSDKTEYAYVLIGNPGFTINDLNYEGNPGDFFILNQGISHGIKNLTDQDCLVLFGALYS